MLVTFSPTGGGGQKTHRASQYLQSTTAVLVPARKCTGKCSTAPVGHTSRFPPNAQVTTQVVFSSYPVRTQVVPRSYTQVRCAPLCFVPAALASVSYGRVLVQIRVLRPSPKCAKARNPYTTQLRCNQPGDRKSRRLRCCREKRKDAIQRLGCQYRGRGCKAVPTPPHQIGGVQLRTAKPRERTSPRA